MFCHSARKMISLERDGLLPAEKTKDLLRHLDGCEECRQYRADLEIGSRLLRATTPEPADNFNWKLQLKLGRTLQQAAAGNGNPWGETRGGPVAWLRTFALSSFAGAAVIALLAVWVLPDGGPFIHNAASPAATAQIEGAGRTAAANPTIGLDRLPLTPLRTSPTERGFGGLTVNQKIAGGSGRLFSASPSYFGSPTRVDTDVIDNLRLENTYLRRRLALEGEEIKRLKALLNEHEIDLLENAGNSME